MFGFMWLFDSWSFTDCLLFGAIISATDPGKFVFLATVLFAAACMLWIIGYFVCFLVARACRVVHIQTCAMYASVSRQNWECWNRNKKWIVPYYSYENVVTSADQLSHGMVKKVRELVVSAFMHKMWRFQVKLVVGPLISVITFIFVLFFLSSVLWCCWLGDWRGIEPVKNLLQQYLNFLKGLFGTPPNCKSMVVWLNKNWK